MESREGIPAGTSSAPFTDHEGRKGISAYWGRAPSPGAPILPPLWSFQFYVTFGAAADSDPGLPERLLTACQESDVSIVPIRLDVNFQPGADPERCMEHYRAEKAARQQAGARLLVTDPYWESGVNFSFLIVVEYADWESMGATMVTFDSDDPDEPRVYIQRGLEWGDVSSSPLDQCVGWMLHSLSTGTEAWNWGNDLYDERLEQGRSDWN